MEGVMRHPLIHEVLEEILASPCKLVKLLAFDKGLYMLLLGIVI